MARSMRQIVISGKSRNLLPLFADTHQRRGNWTIYLHYLLIYLDLDKLFSYLVRLGGIIYLFSHTWRNYLMIYLVLLYDQNKIKMAREPENKQKENPAGCTG